MWDFFFFFPTLNIQRGKVETSNLYFYAPYYWTNLEIVLTSLSSIDAFFFFPRMYTTYSTCTLHSKVRMIQKLFHLVKPLQTFLMKATNKYFHLHSQQYLRCDFMSCLLIKIKKENKLLHAALSHFSCSNGFQSPFSFCLPSLLWAELGLKHSWRLWKCDLYDH